MRHTFATRCIENGMEPQVLKAILGHKQAVNDYGFICTRTAGYKIHGNPEDGGTIPKPACIMIQKANSILFSGENGVKVVWYMIFSTTASNGQCEKPLILRQSRPPA